MAVVGAAGIVDGWRAAVGMLRMLSWTGSAVDEAAGVVGTAGAFVTRLASGAGAGIGAEESFARLRMGTGKLAEGTKGTSATALE